MPPSPLSSSSPGGHEDHLDRLSNQLQSITLNQSSSTSTHQNQQHQLYYNHHHQIHHQPLPKHNSTNASNSTNTQISIEDSLTPAPTPLVPHQPALLNRTISPPTPAPSPQPNSHHHNHNQYCLSWPDPHTQLIPSDDPILLLDAFNALSQANRTKFLNSLLSSLNLIELTNLSAKISPRLKRDFLRELPIEISLHILSFVDDPKTLIRAGMVSRFWRSLINDETTWKGMCWKRGFNSSSQSMVSQSLSKRMEKERKGRVATYKAGVEQQRKRKKNIQSILANQPKPDRSNRPAASERPIPSSSSSAVSTSNQNNRKGLGLDSDTLDLLQSYQSQRPPPEANHLSASSSSSTATTAVAAAASTEPVPSLKLASRPPLSLSQEQNPGNYQHQSLGQAPGGFPLSRRNSYNTRAISPRSGPLRSNEANLTNGDAPPSASSASEFDPDLKQRPQKVISSVSPQPGMVAPTDATLSGRMRPLSMPMLGLNLSLTRSVSAFPDYYRPLENQQSYYGGSEDHHSSEFATYSDRTGDGALETPQSLDIPQTASTIEGSDLISPRSPFSYKNYFKRAYLTESNWMRGPGELLAMQTSQNHDGNEWVVTSIGFDDEWIVVGMATSKIHIFSAITGEFVRALVGHELGVWCLSLVSKGGFRDPRDVRKEEKGKGPEAESALEDEDLGDLSGTVFGFSNPTTEWVSSNQAHPFHSTNMKRAMGGLGVGNVWMKDRQGGSFSNQPSSSEYGSIFQPATTFDDPTFSRWPSSQTSDTNSVPPAPNPQNEDPTFNPNLAHRRPSASSRSRQEPRPIPRRPSSFSSYLSQSTEERYQPGVNSGLGSGSAGGSGGGMGLGAGGPSAGNSQQASACGVARGWGQSRSIVVSGGCDRDIRVWDVLTGKCKFVMHGHVSTIRCLKVLDGRPIAVSGSRDSTLRVWDIELGVQKHVLVGHTLSVRAIEVHDNRAVSGSYDTTCRLWDLDTGECLKVLRGHYHQIYAVAFDGQRIASGSMDSTVCIWSAESGELLALLQGHTALVGQVQMMNKFNLTDQNVLVTGGSDGRVVIFNLDSFECLHRLCAHDNSVTCLQFDQRFVVTGGNDGRVKLWDFKTGQFIRELSEPCEAVWRVVIRDDKVVLLCKRDGRTVLEVFSFRP